MRDNKNKFQRIKINFREVVCKVRIKNDQIQGELFET